MNLETQIKPELWQAVADSYESENYTHAIKDAMSFVTEVLRDRSGFDGDGYTLAGQALNFSKDRKPMIQVNSLQTETERDIQRGLMFSLQGLYVFVRNPRTHERLQDSKKSADVIIPFIDYCLGFLGRSQPSYTVQDFLELLKDPHFVSSKEYAQDIVDLIPVRKRTDTLVEIYRKMTWKQSDNFALVIEELFPKLSDGEIDSLASVISDDFQIAKEISTITLVIKAFPSQLWPRIRRMSRLRAEGMLLEELKLAWYIPDEDRTNYPSSTWINRIAKYISRKEQLRQTIIKKLKSEDFDEQNYVARFLMQMDALPDVFETEVQVMRCVDAIGNSLRAGNEYMKDALIDYIRTTSPPEWDDAFFEGLKDLTDPEHPEMWFHDGIPFLGRFQAQSQQGYIPEPDVDEDSIPF